MIAGPTAALLIGATITLPSARTGAAQDSVPPPPRQAPLQTPDTSRADSTGLVPVFDQEVPRGPLAPGYRITFTRDSILWSTAITLADLLSDVPGVFVARGGFLGQPEYVMYAGRGPSSIEILWDGNPLHPLGNDSIYVDPGRIPLSYLERVDVEVLPSSLRVHLVTQRYQGLGSHSAIRVMSGAFSTAEYAGLFQKRWQNGIGISVAADFTGSEGFQAVSRSDNLLDLWVSAEWQPMPTTGVSYQIHRQDLERDTPVEDGGAPARKGVRTDLSFRMSHAPRRDRNGLSFDLGVGSSSYSDSITIDQRISQAFGTIKYALPFLTAEITGRLGDARIERGLEGRFGWRPVAPLVMSASGYWRDHGSGRTSRMATVQGGLMLGPLYVSGEASKREGFQAPALLTDSIQITNDLAAKAGLRTKRLTGGVGIARRDAYAPLAAPEFPSLPVFDSTPAATFFIADVQLRPIDPVTLTAWYSHPDVGAGALQPPKHGRADITFRSRFLRQFRSGVYDFKLSYGIEFWSRGVAGSDDGVPIELPGATFHELFAQIRLVDFRVFYNLRNARNSRAQYVPGLPYPRNAQTFGVKWEFTN